jgi:hypothetical protein
MTTFFDSSTFSSVTVETGGFIAFAKVADMSTVDYIMRLNQASIPGGNLASSDIPVIGADDNLLVFVERAFVLDPDPIVPNASVSETLSVSLSETTGDLGAPSSAALPAVGVPEPSALVLALGALMMLAARKGRRL